MKTGVSDLLVWVEKNNAWIKIAGRASFNSSVDFKTLVNGLSQKGFSRFVLDLTDCPLMDSTFLGVLAGLGLKFGAAHNGDPRATIELLNPKPRILDLLENLGVSHLFKVLNGPEPATEKMASVECPPPNADRKEISRACLEAHQTLMNINPANIPKFKDVAQFLAEDLKKMEGEAGKKEDET
jgi:anti-anti-sigma regulatory factor